MKETKKPAYGDYTPSAQKQAHIDELINAATRKAFGKVVTKEGCIGIRNSYSEKGGAPYQRYVLSNDHTVFAGDLTRLDYMYIHLICEQGRLKSNTPKHFLTCRAHVRACGAPLES